MVRKKNGKWFEDVNIQRITVKGKIYIGKKKIQLILNKLLMVKNLLIARKTYRLRKTVGMFIVKKITEYIYIYIYIYICHIDTAVWMHYLDAN